MICENCSKEHDGSYGSGRFCSCYCARSFSTKNISKESNEKRLAALSKNHYKGGSRKGRSVSDETKLKIHNYQVKVQEEWEQKWLSGEIDGFNKNDHFGGIPTRIRNYLFKKHHNKCAVCGWGELNSYTNSIPLEVEHIDGNYKNNRPENLTLLCPNCHSLTKTYRGANRGSGRKKSWHMIEN